MKFLNLIDNNTNNKKRFVSNKIKIKISQIMLSNIKTMLI